MRLPSLFVAIVACLALSHLTLPSWSFADEGEDAAADTSPEQKARWDAFEKSLSGKQLRGNFTITGKEDAGLKEETYIIKRVTKLPKDDYWMFHATIKYGDKNVTVPMPLKVLFAGDTGVITLDDVKIPGLGTFSSRVVIDGNRYAGTWQHDDVGGHLFGMIEEIEKEE